MAEGFLSRWSQRKQAVRAGQPVVEVIDKNRSPALAVVAQSATKKITKCGPEAQPDSASHTAPAPASAWAPAPASASASADLGPAQSDTTPDGTPAPTLDDVHALQPSDSFARFVAHDVSPEVRNAAMKKLFTDPHYNVMDGLDIYIDDYSIASPLPAATLRQMASAKFLNLFDEDPPPGDAQGATPVRVGEVANTAPTPNVAQSAPAPDLTGSPAPLPTALPVAPLTPAPLALDALSKDISHDDPDLRLQPNDVAGRAAVKREPERAPDAAQQPVSPPGR